MFRPLEREHDDDREEKSDQGQWADAGDEFLLVHERPLARTRANRVSHPAKNGMPR